MDEIKRTYKWRLVCFVVLSLLQIFANSVTAQNPAPPKDAPPKMGTIVRCAISADGKRVVAGDDHRVIRIWDVSQRKVVRVIRDLPHSIPCYAFSKDCKSALVANGLGFVPKDAPALLAGYTLTFWDLDKGAMARSLDLRDESVRGMALSADGARALTVSHWITVKDDTGRGWRSDGDPYASLDLYRLRLWDTTSGKLIRTLDDDCGVWPPAFSADGKLAAHGFIEPYQQVGKKQKWPVRTWNASDGRGAAKELMVPAWEPIEIWAIALSPDGKHLAIGHYAGLSLWNVTTGKLEWYHDNSILTSGGTVASTWPATSIVFSSDGNRIVASGPGKQATLAPVHKIPGGMTVLDAATGKTVPGFSATKEWVGSVSFTQDGTQLVGAAVDGVRFWDGQTGKVLFTLHD
jgi:WD40 repeat protein